MAGVVVTLACREEVAPGYEGEVSRTRRDIGALERVISKAPRDLEKQVRLAFRQYHLASLTASESDFEKVGATLAGIIRDFGPKEDVCLLKASLDGRFHRLAAVKEDLQMCPALASRFEGRAILAEVDFQEGRYVQARAGFEGLIEERRTWDNLARLAHWHGQMGHPEEADELYLAAEVELSAKEMRSFAWLELQRGEFAMRDGLLEKARRHYQRAAAGYPGHWQTDEHFAALAAAAGESEKAIGLWKLVIARADKPEAKQALAEVSISVGRTDEARPWLEAARATYLASAKSGAVHYFHHLADYYSGVGAEPEEAVKWARKDLALRSNFSTQSALARALCLYGELAEAREWILLALNSGAQEPGMLRIAAKIFHALEDETRAEFYDRVAPPSHPHGHGLHFHH